MASDPVLQAQMIRMTAAYVFVVIALLCSQGKTARAQKTAFLPVNNPGALSHFHRTLRRTARQIGTTRILQYGASHTSADIFTGYMRRFFQERFGDAGHGFVMPAKPWSGYRNMDVNIESSDTWLSERVGKKESRKDGLFGLAGYSCASTNSSDFARVYTTQTNTFGRNVSNFQVLFLRQPGGGAFDILVDGEHYTRVLSKHPTVAAGHHLVRVSDGPHKLEIRPAGDGEVRLFGVVMERDKAGVIVDSLGIRGMRASVHLRWNEDLWRKYIQKRNPDLVILAYGTNESGDTHAPIERYESQLSRVIKRFKSAVPRASCVLVGPTDYPVKIGRRRVKHRPRTDQIISVQKKIGRALGCAFWDSAKAMGGPLSILKWSNSELRLAGDDFIHLTARGYRQLSEDFCRALLSGYESVR